MKDFEGVVEFLAVADTESFTAASNRLGVSISHVSRRVSSLEARLGVRLFARSTRRVRLSEIGREFRARCQALTADYEEAIAAICDVTERLEGTLRISALSGSFAEQMINPALVSFASLHPDLDVHVDFSPRPVDFILEGADFAIRSGMLPDSGLVARRLANRTVVAAASPDYLARHGVPETPQDLASHKCLLSNSDRWRFDGPDGPFEVKVRGSWQSNSGSSLTEACVQGLGVSYMACSGYGDALTSGRLVPVLQPYWRQDHPVWIVYPDRKFLSRRARAAVEFLLDFCRDYDDCGTVPERFEAPADPGKFNRKNQEAEETGLG